MKRRDFAFAGLSVAAAAALGQAANAQQPSEKHEGHTHRGYGEHFEHCAKACGDCQRECDRCAIHCAGMLSQGKDDHKITLQTCLDCADFCMAAAQIVSRGGPFSMLICESCAEACKKCGEACAKHPNDELMRKCAEECKKCEEACRKMVRTAKDAKSEAR